MPAGLNRLISKMVLLIPIIVTIVVSGSLLLNCLPTSTPDGLGISSLIANLTSQPASSQDFSIAPIPSNIVQNGYSNFSSLITISSINGFSGDVSLAVNANSTSLSCTLNSTMIMGGSGQANLLCGSDSSGNYLATVTGTSGSLRHSANVIFSVPPLSDGFVISSNPASTNVVANDFYSAAGIVMIPVTELYGFKSRVYLTVSSNSTNLNCNFVAVPYNQTEYLPAGLGPTWVWVDCQGSIAGNYLATVTGSGSSISHSTTIVYHVQDFAVTTSSTSLSVGPRQNATTILTIAAVNGFSRNLTLMVATSSPSLSCSISTTRIQGGSGSVILSCSSNTDGSYSAVVTLSSGLRVQTVAMGISVKTTILGLSPILFYASVGAGAAVVVVSILLLKRRGRDTRKTGSGQKSSPALPTKD